MTKLLTADQMSYLIQHTRAADQLRLHSIDLVERGKYIEALERLQDSITHRDNVIGMLIAAAFLSNGDEEGYEELTRRLKDVRNIT